MILLNKLANELRFTLTCKEILMSEAWLYILL